MFGGGKAFRKVRPQLGHQHERRAALDAGPLRQIHPAGAVEFLAGIKARLVLRRRLVGAGARRQRLGDRIGLGGNGVLTTLCAFGAFTNWSINSPAGQFSEPYTGLVQGSNGNFYGVTYGGGTNNDQGAAYEITTNGVLTVLYSFGALIDGNYLDGSGPYDPLVQGSDGSFYGTTEGGGTNGAGTVFRLTTIVPELPQLTITLLGADVILTWPTNATGFTLQSTTNMALPD